MTRSVPWIAGVLLAAFAGSAVAQTTKLRALNTENDALAWQAVGRLDIARQGYCTGTLIAPDLVLTAAHCVYDSASNAPIAPKELTFQAGLTHGVVAARRGVSQIEAHAGYDPGASHSLANVAHDIALVRLDAPILTHELNPFAVFAGEMPRGTVSVVSYGRGRSDALSRQNQCEVVGQYRELFALDCDLTFGSSGAPVFTHLNGRGQIASVISGGGVVQGKEVALGMALPALLSELKSQMRANASRPKATVRRLQIGGGKQVTGAKFVKP